MNGAGRLLAGLFALAAVPVWSVPALAGAWTLPAGEGQAILSGLGSVAEERFDAGRDRVPGADFGKVALGAFIEYGVLDGLTAIGRAEFDRETGDGGRGSGLKQLEIAGRVRLFQRGGTVAGAELGVGIDDPDGVAGRARGMEWGAPSGQVRLAIGHGFTLLRRAAFAEASGGYRLRTGDEPDEVTLDATFGLRPVPHVLLLAQSFSTLANETGVKAYDYHKLQGSLVYDLTETVSLQAGGFTTIAGRNALGENGLVTALWLRF